jgi:hypothetical protein
MQNHTFIGRHRLLNRTAVFRYLKLRNMPRRKAPSEKADLIWKSRQRKH